MTINNIRQAEKALMAYVPSHRQLSRKDTVMDRIRPLMALLGNPQNNLKVVHVAGTSGKTSTAYYLAALLKAGGQKTGLTVSPHIDSITERIQINGQPLAEDDFCQQLGEFLEVVEKSGLQPSYFELLYAFALWVLGRRGVDYAVIETGVGGLHDATNVANRADKVCIITDIDFDHMHLLGNTLPEIAAQKIGIVHEHNHVFIYRQGKAVMKVIEHWTGQHQAPLHIVSSPPIIQDNMPDYQQRNWHLAHTVYQYLAERDKLPSLTSQVLHKTQQTVIPGRMDISHINGKTVIMDGAHNAQKMAAFVDSFQRLHPDIKPAILLALKEGKDYQEVVPVLAGLPSQVIVTTFETSQDLPVRSMDAEVLAAACRQAGLPGVEVIADHRAAFQALLSTPAEVAIVTGSFYLLGQIRNNA